jgi:arylsulfatase A-like enzyme
VTDWLPTLLSAAGTQAPESWPVDGIDLAPLLQGEEIEDRPLSFYLPLYDLRWGLTPCAVVREGPWKLIEYFGDWVDSDGVYHRGEKLELFHLVGDIGESENLAETQSERAAKMQGRLHAWMQSFPVPIPGHNPHFDPARPLKETREKPVWYPAE